jgi:hypothetical protein
MKLNTDELRQVVELLAIAITADLPETIRLRIAERLQELGQHHTATSANAGTHCIALANLLRSLPNPTTH